MKTFRGILLIAVTLTITLVVWISASPEVVITSLDRARHIVAGMSLGGFVLVFLLSTRSKTITKWFNGLENVYVYHKFLAIFSVASVIVHAVLGELVTIAGTEGLAAVNFSELINTAQAPLKLNTALGTLATVLFVILALTTLFYKSLKYEWWRISHRIMLVAYIIGMVHTYLSSEYDLLKFNALGIWMGLLVITSILSGLYIIFVYQNREFKNNGKITAIEKLSPEVMKLEITLDQPLTYTKGQFIFLKIFQKNIHEEPHPFSISGGVGLKIYITIKKSGDFTEDVLNHLELGTQVKLTRPYGKMDFSKGRKQQLWIAGGIGITPFISYLDENKIDQTVEMYYSYQGQDAAIFRSFLEKYQSTHPNFSVHFTDTSIEERLNFDDYMLNNDLSIFMCGPTQMMSSFAKVFKEKQPNTELIYEGFKFR